MNETFARTLTRKTTPRLGRAAATCVELVRRREQPAPSSAAATPTTPPRGRPEHAAATLAVAAAEEEGGGESSSSVIAAAPPSGDNSLHRPHSGGGATYEGSSCSEGRRPSLERENARLHTRVTELEAALALALQQAPARADDDGEHDGRVEHARMSARALELERFALRSREQERANQYVRQMAALHRGR